MTDWTEQSAVAKYNEVLETSQYDRAVMETMCGLWQLMGWSADQWVGVGRGMTGGTAIKKLQPVFDPGRNDVRLAMNEIRRAIKENTARTNPRELEWTVDPATESPRDRSAAQVGHKRLELQLMPTMALDVLGDNNIWRATLGSSVIRRCMMPREDGIELRDATGAPLLDEDGEPRVLPGAYEHWWEVAPPCEIVRDPSARSWRFDNEEFVGHEKACPVAKVQAMFPDFKMPEGGVKSTMGELLQFQSTLWNQTRGACGVGMSVSESKQPAVMICEGWYRGRGWKWTHYLAGWRDSGDKAPGARGIHPLQFGKNPYHEVPLHPFVFDWPPGRPWGMGLAEELTPHQMMKNLSITALLRLILDAGGRYIININGLRDKKVDEILASRTKPFIVNSQQDMKSVDRISPNSQDPNLMIAMAKNDEWFNAGAATSDALRGVSSKRGESNKAIQTKIGQAEGPIMSAVDRDERIVNQLLTGTLADLGSTSTPEEMDTLLGGEFGPDEIAAFLSIKFDDSAPSVTVARDSLRPKPPEESLRNLSNAVQSQMIDGTSARRAHMIRTGEGLDPVEEEAYWEQMAEIRAMSVGQQTPVEFMHHHDMHMWTIQYAAAKPRYRSYPPEVRKAIEAHWYEHHEMKQALAGGQNPFGQPQEQQEQGQDGGAPPEGQPGPGMSQVTPAGVGGAGNVPANAARGPGVLPPQSVASR